MHKRDRRNGRTRKIKRTPAQKARMAEKQNQRAAINRFKKQVEFKKAEDEC